MSSPASSGPRTGSTRSPREVVCIICRQRKVKCDRKKPSCGFCFKAGLDCKYPGPNKRPGIRAGYVTELEKRLTTLEREFKHFKQQHASPVLQTSSQGFAQGSRNSAQNSNCETVHNIETPNTVQLEFTIELISDFCTVWFEKYHPWFPILHRPSISECLELPDIALGSSQTLVLKSILAVILPHWHPDINLNYTKRVEWSENLKQQIRLKAIAELSFPALQAMLILSLLDYGSGSMSEFWNSIALCQRMSVQLGLRDLVVNFCVNYGNPSIIPPRMLVIPNTTVGFEERIRAFWVAEILDSASTIGAAWNFHISRPEITSWTPCDDDIWALPEGLIGLFPFGSSEKPSAFSLYVMLVNNELWHVHNFFQQFCDMSIPEVREKRYSLCQSIDGRLQKWHSSFNEVVIYNSPTSATGYANAVSDLGSPNPNKILIHCTVDSAIVSLYQGLIVMPSADDTHSTWDHGLTRCVEACDHMVSILRPLTEENLENMSPQLIPCIFVAARFYIVHARMLNLEIPVKLDLLAYVLNMCGQRWPLARRLTKLIRFVTLGQESNTLTSFHELPVEFWDWQYGWPDIYEAIKTWSDRF